MKEKTVKEYILEFLRDGQWHFGGPIEEYIRAVVGSKGGSTSRICRYMENDGLLDVERVKVNGKGIPVVKYRIKIKETLF